MADQKIELEIVLDDGSIRKAFGTIKTEAEKAGKETNNAFGSIGNFGAATIMLNQGIELFGKMASAVKGVAEEFVKMALEAEKVRVTQAQFVQLTQQAGIATAAFDEAIQNSIAGLIDDDDALQLANQAMIRLGATAARLPEIFELSRKAAASGFGDIVSNTEALTQAIQTGQTRQLRSLGLTIDLTKAQKEYAASVGLTADQLSEETKQQINANVILDATAKKYQNVDANVRSFSDALQRFEVTAGQAYEKVAVAIEKAFGQSAIDTINHFNFILGNMFGVTTDQQKVIEYDAKIRELKDSIQELTNKARPLSAIMALIFPKANEEAIARLNAQIKEYNAEIDKIKNKAKEAATAQAASAKTLAEANKGVALSEEDRANQVKNRLEAQKKADAQSAQFQQQELAARQQNVQFIDDLDAQRLEKEAIYQEQLRLITEKGVMDRKMIADTYKNENDIGQEQRRALELQQIEAQNAQVLALQNKMQNDSLDAFDQQAKRRQQQFKNFAVVAKTFFFDVISQGFQQVGAALVNGENAFKAFGQVFLGILGDIVIALGNSFIAAGIANTFIPLFGFGGIGAIGAGAALVVLGGALKALSGGAGQSSFSQGAGSANQGGGNFSDTNNFNPANPVQAERIQPNTVVNFNVQGDVLDSEDTQNRIVKLLNDAIDTKGAVVRGI